MDIQISKAEWFAAHAPSIIPAWFKPAMPTDKPTVRGYWYHGETEEETRWLQEYFNDETMEWSAKSNGVVPDAFKDKLETHYQDHETENKAEIKWIADYEIAKYMQWPVHYGRLMAEAFGEKQKPLPNTRGITAVNISREELPNGGGEAYTIGIQFNHERAIHIPVKYDTIKPAFAWFTGEQHQEGNVNFVHIPLIPRKL